MLEFNPKLRISAIRALNHEFFSAYEVSETNDDISDQITLAQNIQTFTKHNEGNVSRFSLKKDKLHFKGNEISKPTRYHQNPSNVRNFTFTTGNTTEIEKNLLEGFTESK
jgi:hypothetical protein